METKDLMIGDWVINSINNKYYKVSSLTSDIELEGDGFILHCLCDDVEPIPLTAEILEKNGFDVSDKEVVRYYFNEDGEDYHFSLRQMYDRNNTPCGYSFFAFNVLTIIDYVHELQHALRLCGVDKEIKV